MGPLANPARVTRQLIGIARPDYAPVYAEALDAARHRGGAGRLGRGGARRAVAAPAPAWRVSRRRRRPCRRASSPEDAGLPRHPLAAIRGGDPALQRRWRCAACSTARRGAYRDAVLLNAAAALVVAGRARRPGATASSRAAEAIDSGAAARPARPLDRLCMSDRLTEILARPSAPTSRARKAIGRSPSSTLRTPPTPAARLPRRARRASARPASR